MTPAPTGVARWIETARLGAPPPAAGSVELLIPPMFERYLVVAHHEGPGALSPGPQVLTSGQLKTLEQVLGAGEISVGVWLGAPTELRQSAAGLERFFPRPGIECVLVSATIAELIDAQLSPSAPRPEQPNQSGYVHRLNERAFAPLAFPYIWWADAHDWIVVIDVDCDFTVVGCSASVGKRLAESDLMASEVQPSDQLTQIGPTGSG